MPAVNETAQSVPFETLLADAREFEANFDRFIADAGLGKVDGGLQARLCSQVMIVTDEAAAHIEKGFDQPQSASQSMTLSILRGIPDQFERALENAQLRAGCGNLSIEQVRTTKGLYLTSARLLATRH